VSRGKAGADPGASVPPLPPDPGAAASAPDQPQPGQGNPPVLIIGLGNILLGDEGIGVRAVEELERRYRLPPAVQILDGGTAGMELFEPMRRCSHLILLDAIQANSPPGTLIRLVNEEIRALLHTKLSTHQLALADLLALLRLRGEAPAHITLIGLVPTNLELGLDLSLSASAGLEAMVDLVSTELRALGIEPTPRPTPTLGHWRRQVQLVASLWQGDPE